MKILKEVASVILMLAFLLSLIFNVLFLFNIIDKSLTYTGLFIVLLTAAAMSLTGIIVKNIRKDEIITINIMTPAKEIGHIYTYLLSIWALTYFIVIFFK